MKKINFFKLLMLMVFTIGLTTKLVSAISAPVADSITITIYLDCRDWKNMTATPGSPDSAANAHNISQRSQYDPSVFYLTGHWTPPTEPGKGDWTFFTMQTTAVTDVFKVTFKYGVGHFPGKTSEDPDLKADCPGWYFCPTNDWGTNEWVPAPCNKAWDVQRVFCIDITKPDTTVAFKYGVCEPVPLSSLGLGLGINQTNLIPFSVSPNPTTNQITIKNSQVISTIKLYDFTGKLVKLLQVNGQKEITVSLDGMPAQLYLLQAQQIDGKLYTTKISKK
jgi:hypothetical protein